MPDLLNRLLRRRPSDEGLSCNELVELVSDYLEGALPAVDHARFEAHVAGCVNCAAYVRQMRETLVLLGSLPADALSREAEEELRTAFRDWNAGTATQS
jgi:anti-sigma factor RsiW